MVLLPSCACGDGVTSVASRLETDTLFLTGTHRNKSPSLCSRKNTEYICISILIACNLILISDCQMEEKKVPCFVFFSWLKESHFSCLFDRGCYQHLVSSLQNQDSFSLTFSAPPPLLFGMMPGSMVGGRLEENRWAGSSGEAGESWQAGKFDRTHFTTFLTFPSEWFSIHNSQYHPFSSS